MSQYYFIKGDEGMSICVHDNNLFTINGYGKIYEDFDSYYKELIKKGWIKVNIHEYCKSIRKEKKVIGCEYCLKEKKYEL